MFILHRLLPWLYASVTGFITASTSHSQFVLSRLTSLGIDIPLRVRVLSTFDDIIGLSLTYLPILAIGLALGFSCAHWLAWKLPHQRKILFALAGFCAVETILLCMYPIMEITLIAGARSWGGLIAQGLSGALAGLIFVATTPTKTSQQST